MRYNDLLQETSIPAISPQQAHDGGMFGPLYHGTTGSLEQIIATGFDSAKGIPHAIDRMNRPIGTSNGYALEGYGFTGIAPPVHHLGFGMYMTTVKAIAKQYAGGSMRGMRIFYLESKRVLEINFGSSNTMMRWWREHGYDMTSEATRAYDMHAWTAATLKLTFNLQREYDAVWFKGKGIRKLLDGDQVCIYNTELLRVVDMKAARGLEIGAKVTHTQVIPEDYRSRNVFYVDDVKSDDFGSAGRLVGWRGIYRADEEPKRDVGRYPMHFIPPPGMVGVIVAPFLPGIKYFSVKWAKGGVMYNYRPEELQPV